MGLSSRNRFVFEVVQDHPSKILEGASKLLIDYRGVHMHVAVHISGDPQGKDRNSQVFYQCYNPKDTIVSFVIRL